MAKAAMLFKLVLRLLQMLNLCSKHEPAFYVNFRRLLFASAKTILPPLTGSFPYIAILLSLSASLKVQ
jgi:hypothetical protein